MVGGRRARLALSARCIALWSGVVTSLAAADYPRDRAAREMIRKAIEEVYVKPEFDEAERILLGTIDACESKCRQSTLARAYMYTGIVRGSGKLDQEGAFEAFVGALKMDPDVELDAALATEETLATWERARASRPRPKRTPEAERDPVEPPQEAAASEREVCPPGLPACAAEGDRCEHSVECQRGLSCAKLAGADFETCNEPARCDDDAECGPGKCIRGVCEEPKSSASKSEAVNWLGLHGAFDVAWLPETRSVCSVESNAAGDYVCFAGDRPYTRDPSSTGPDASIDGGFAPATTRLLMSFDRSMAPHWLAGLRAGFALGGSEREFLPIHVELRGRYLFGGRLLRPFASLSAGIAQVDTRLPLNIRENADDPEPTPIEAHAAFGRFFGSGGTGVLLAPSEGVRFELSLSAAALFPSFGIALEASAGVAMGL